MPIDPKEALEFFGYDPETFEDAAAFRSQVEKDWIKPGDAHLNTDVQKRIFGKLNGVLRTTLKNSAEALGLDAAYDGDDMDPIDGLKALAVDAQKKLAALKEAKKDGSTSKEVAELQRQYDESKKATADVNKLLLESNQKYNELEASVAKEKAEAKVNGLYSSAIAKIPFKEGMSAFEKQGFIAAIKQNFQLHFDDEGKEYVTDSNGDRIKDKKKAASHVDLDTAILNFAIESKLTADQAAPAAVRRTVPITGQGMQPKTPPVEGRKLRTIAG